MTDDTLSLLEGLTNAPGVSGFEGPVREIMQCHLEPFGEVSTDHLGSVIGRKVGRENGPKIMLAGHMDEVGFMITRITDDGYLKFQPLGGWWDQVLSAQRVEVYTRHGSTTGVIGTKAIHIMPVDERKKVYEKKDMFIDIGASSREEVESFGIRPGDPVVPICPFTVMRNPKLLMAKAWDNRFGCALAIEVLRRLKGQPHPNVLYAVGNVQEEVGLRGAATSTYLIEPDIGFALEACIAGDTPGVTVDEASARLGKGPVILLYDGSMIPHTGLRDFVIDIAVGSDIPIQLDTLSTYGTDAGRFHTFGVGVPSLVIGVPVRYIHTHAAIMNYDDFDNAARLLVAVVQRLDVRAVEGVIKPYPRCGCDKG